MTLVAFEANDCVVGIKGGKLFITGVKKCSHGHVNDKVTIWLPLELQSKLNVIEDHDGAHTQTHPRFNVN